MITWIEDDGETTAETSINAWSQGHSQVIKGSHIADWDEGEESEDDYTFEVTYFDDVGYIDNEGYLYIGGRSDDVINVSGHRISTSEIESILISLSSITLMPQLHLGWSGFS